MTQAIMHAPETLANIKVKPLDPFLQWLKQLTTHQDRHIPTIKRVTLKESKQHLTL